MKMIEKKSEGRTKWIGAGLAFLGTLCLPYILNLKGNTLAISNSWFGVFIWAVLWFITCRAMDGGRAREKREWMAAGLLAFFFSVSLAFGVSLERAESVDFTNGMLWLSIAVWTVLFTFWICRGWELLKDRDKGKSRFAGGSGKAAEGKAPGKYARKDAAAGTKVSTKMAVWMDKWNNLSGRKQAVLMVCFFLLCWLPVFLAVYPGFFVYDAQDELLQVQTRSFTTHHPLPHVLLLGGIVLAGNKLAGSYNAGIAAYTFLQMCLMACVFTYVLAYMKKSRVKRSLRVITAFYFGLFPVNVMFVLCSAKDSIFSAAFLLLLISLYEMAGDRKGFWSGWRNPLFFSISALVMMCFRHNGMYALLVLVPFLLFFMKGCRKKLGMALGMTFAAYFLITAGLAGILSAEDSENQEMLTVPIQQMARVYKYDKESLSAEDLEVLYEVIPEEALRFYAPKVSDGVKIWFDNEAFAADPVKYGKLWLKLGLGHPFTYWNAWLMTSYGFWYPDTVIDVYRGNGVFTFTYEDSSFFGYEVEEPGIRESRIPWLDTCYRRMSLEIFQQKIPLVSMLFSPGFLFWIFAFTVGYAFYRRKYQALLPFALLLLLWLTVILGPTYLPRYVLVFWFALPGAAALLGPEHVRIL